MRTNLEKYNFYKQILTDKAEVFMDKHYLSLQNKDIVNTFYLIRSDGIIQECQILYRFYKFKESMLLKPTRQDVLDIKLLSETNYDFEVNRIGIRYKYCEVKSYMATSTILANQLYCGTNENICFSKSDAEIISEKKINDLNKTKLFYNEHQKDKNYNYDSNGYKFLGWSNGQDEDPIEYLKCKELKHILISVSHNNHGSENSVSCPECKIYWKYDCSG